MSSLEQVWISKGSVPPKWAAWLRGHYPVRTIARPPAAKHPSRASAVRHTVWIADPHRDRAALRGANQLRLTRVIEIGGNPRDLETASRYFARLPRDSSQDIVESIVAAAFRALEIEASEREARDDLMRHEREMELMQEVGIALSSARDVNQVLRLILRKAREATSADGGSIYVVEEDQTAAELNAEKGRVLRFRLAENDSVELPHREMTLPISESSIAGYVAMHGEPVHLKDAYEVPAGAPYHFNDQLDTELNYRTRSLLTLPMRNAKGEVIGVLQLINCKRDPKAKLTNPKTSARQVQPFSLRSLQMVMALASQAAVSYENSKLYQDIEQLFEGFVRASVTAIEQRDPTTSGHSHRVSNMTCGLAEVVTRTDTGIYAASRFSPEQMKEIRYAALLHDFGKVAVREQVLVKAKKLYPDQLAIVQNRFDYVRKDMEACFQRRKLETVMKHGPAGARQELDEIDGQLRQKMRELDEAFEFIVRANEPTVMPEGNFERLLEIAQQTFRDPRGIERGLLTPDEVKFLSIPKGSLDDIERQEIESHVVHSFNFLMQIPWTREMRGIPAIARAHHEKLNGTGYPYRLRAPEIPLQAKIMTICDMFDALSASDRPYKKAVSTERALDILKLSVRDNELDPVLFQLFVDARIFQLMQNRY
ncbi:MAG TPA: HD domain-containing phosphohydrolase [Candidatus Acidoferrales bacterium]|nr:HD domain-containing phosphohydrolase [Candidatus Acidoferrales bacterium]